MSEQSAWSVTNLQSGDEVGIQVGERQGASRVVAIHDNGVIEIEGDDYYGPDGRNLFMAGISRMVCRLIEPTDEGRLASLRECLLTDLDILAGQANRMPLEKLKRLRAAVMALAAEFEVEL